MSFDLKIESNDLAINTDGTVQTVRDNDKLVQDIIKSILTTIGSNRFHKWYGNALSAEVIGKVLDVVTIETEAQRTIQNTLSTMMALQNAQARMQYVSAGETIAAIRSITVLRDNVDPRQFQIAVSVLTRKLNVVEETFEMRV
jgi:hypothetical protein